ncbi:MAG: hypothetical protein ACI9F9_001256 [Candidatus Paceibacteria bacterium]|jgi:hypothetical protein
MGFQAIFRAGAAGSELFISYASYPFTLKNQLGFSVLALCLGTPAALAFQSTAQPSDERSRSLDRAGVVQIEKDGSSVTTHVRGNGMPSEGRSRSGGASDLPGSLDQTRGNGEENLGDCDAPNRRNAGSLLLFPEYDNRQAARTVFSVTNTSADEAVDVEFVYIGRYGPSIGGDLVNGDFDNDGAGWTVDVSPPNGGAAGTVTFENGRACLLENNSLLTTLQQTFVMPEGAATLDFDVYLDPGFDTSGGFIPDAFEAQLLDGALNSVVPTWHVSASSFFNLQEDLTANLGPGTTYSGSHVSVDVTGVSVGQVLTLYFDLIGADSDDLSGVKLDNVHITAAAPTDLDCAEFNRTEHLTPGDTLTLFTDHHNPNLSQGFAFVFAKNSSGEAIAFNHLVGNLMATNAFEASDYSMNAVAYTSPLNEGELTDLDTDGVRDLNGAEYQQTAAEILIPRFIGQGNGVESYLIVIALSGGTAFETTLDFLAYNDNEEVFSTEFSFHCWDRVALRDISALFSNEFLAMGTGHDPLESLGDWEAGWMRINGAVATSSTYSIADPAFYAVQVESLLGSNAADLPFELCSQSGHLLPRTLDGDNEE